MTSFYKISRKLFQRSVQFYKNPKSYLSNGSNIPRLKKFGAAAIAAAVGGTAIVGIAVPVLATELEMHSPSLPWYHKNHLHSFDHASLRRGYQVYREVCAACHSMKYLCFRHLVGVCVTEEEAKAIAAEYQIVDGPNDDGEMFERPGRLSDNLPNPYENEVKARMANNGSLPPDFSYIVLSKHGHEDYIFHLLTGYTDPPAGKPIAEGQHYNPYFPGGAISMARALYEELIEYEDGTPATTSQMAKDVSTFLAWAADPHHDDRKRIGLKVMGGLIFSTIIVWYWNKKIWTYIKHTKLAYKNRPPRRQF